MIDIKTLRNSIYDMATSGRLSSDFLAEDSVESILGSLPAVSTKRKKLLMQEYDYDSLFDIPKHWQWIKLGEISSYGDTPQKVMASDVDGNTWLLELEDIEAGGRLLGKKRVSSSKSIGEKTKFKEGQVLYSKLRPYLRKILVADEDGISTPELISFDLFGGINPRYITFCLLNSYTDRVIDKRSYGIKMPRVDAGFMANLPIPLPPISEQDYIVEKAKQVFSTISTIDDYQTRYVQDAEIIKGKLIDAGIQGKLTEQHKKDGTAKELLERISEEKEQLMSSGKIPKEKNLKDIKPDEIPFEIPDTWEWVRVQDVASYITDYVANGSFATLKAHTKTYKEPNYALFVRTVDLSSNFTDGCSYIDKESYDFLQKSQLFGGELILPNIGASIGKAFIMPDMGMPMSLAPNSILLKFTDPIMNEYFSFVVKSSYGSKLLNKTQGGSATAKFSKTDLRSLVVPLPPLNEIKRIVDIINHMNEILI